MKKSTAFILVLVMITALLFSCSLSFPTKEKVAERTSEEATKLLKDKTAKEIYDHWGTPDDTLSGFYGDIYVYNGKTITIYYDADSKVTDVLVTDK